MDFRVIGQNYEIHDIIKDSKEFHSKPSKSSFNLYKIKIWTPIILSAVSQYLCHVFI